MLVLVAEDDDATREALAECLRSDGFDVFAVAGGREALEVVESIPADVILLDLLMRDMDGWAFRLEQRKRPAVADIPVVVMTGLPLANAATMGAAACLSKPFTVEALTAAILRVTRPVRQGDSSDLA